MMNVQKHITTLESALGERHEERRLIQTKAVDDARTFSQEELDKLDLLEGEIEQIDNDVNYFKTLEQQNMKTATPINKAPGFIRERGVEDFQGQGFVRTVIARALAKQTGVNPAAIAEKRYGKSNPRLVEHIKADIAGGGTGSGEWGSELVTSDSYIGDFIEYLHGQTVYNQLPLREVPAHVSIKGQDGAATGYWVGESKAIPMSKPDFSTVELAPLKVAAITVISKELLKHANPSSEMLVRDALVQACSQRIDTTFISNSAAVAGSTPAGILNNIAASTSAGTDSDSILNDIKELRQRFITAKNSGGLYWVMNPALASSLSLMRNALGQKEFTEIGQNGGMLEGDPVVVGDNVDANYLVLVKPADIWRIGMQGFEVSVSETATIEHSDAPTGATDTPTAQSEVPVSMFQTDSMAIKAVIPINFARRRESAVAWINDADYGGAIST